MTFIISTKKTDELGRLCNSFEKMRASLYENNLKMWQSIEERKRLNAAFAHDLRNPLTVLKGYMEMLEEYTDNGYIPIHETKDILQTMSTHIFRLESYTKTMKDIQKLDEIEIHPSNIPIAELIKKIKNTSEILCKNNEKKLYFTLNVTSETCYVDYNILMEIYENIFSNAIRYTIEKLCISISTSNHWLSISIEDDGNGFTNEEQKLACEPYYKGDVVQNSTHLGLGLYICKILCEKHKGTLSIQNREIGTITKGAIVSFKISVYIVDKK